MEVKYIGPYDSVTVTMPSGADLPCEQGGTLKLPDELAKNLISQGTWEPVSQKPAKGKEKE